MATIRATMLFEAATADRGRVAGWTESWYKIGTPEAVLDSIKVLCTPRAALMPLNSKIIGQRLQVIGGRSMSDNVVFTGRTRLTNDIPQMAAQCVVGSAGQAQKKSFSVRGLPDDCVTGGDYTGANGLGASFAAFFRRLADDAWQWQARDTSIAATPIVSIAADGTFVLAAPMIFAVGDYVNLVRVKNVTGRSVKGDFFVETKVDNQHGKLFNWTGGQVNLAGKMRVRAYTYPVVSRDLGKVIQVMVRKVGRPLNPYRGRATKRR